MNVLFDVCTTVWRRQYYRPHLHVEKMTLKRLGNLIYVRSQGQWVVGLETKCQQSGMLHGIKQQELKSTKAEKLANGSFLNIVEFLVGLANWRRIFCAGKDGAGLWAQKERNLFHISVIDDLLFFASTAPVKGNSRFMWTDLCVVG